MREASPGAMVQALLVGTQRPSSAGTCRALLVAVAPLVVYHQLCFHAVQVLSQA